VLKRVAGLLTEECGGEHVLGRYGGDEFIVVLFGADLSDASSLARRLRDRVASEGFRRPGDDRVLPITLSFGLAGYPVDTTSRHELLAIADVNLCSAKHSESGIAGTSEVRRSSRKLLRQSSFAALDTMVTAVDNKDRYTRGHSENVTEYALWIAEEMGLSEETMRMIRAASLLHDVGKIGVPDEVLRKPARLSPEELQVMQRHPRIGELIVRAMPGMDAVVDGVRSHHERWDGQGYPEGLVGEEIPLIGRLLAVADALSAMTTDRPYRKGLEWGVALGEIRANMGTQFDPTVVQALLAAVEKRCGKDGLPDGLNGLPKAA
jgi:HD-GYP domain-containing protein (c-di-GMP phosphodiesterase class II)